MRGRTMQGRGLFRAVQRILLLQLGLHLVIGVSDLNPDLVEIREMMDETEDPCEDIYQYSCGDWIENATIPESKTHINTIMKISDHVNQQLKDLLEDKSNEHTLCDPTGDNSTLDCIYTRSTEAIQKAKFFYQACMNEDILEKGDFSLERFHEELQNLGCTDMDILKNEMLMGLMPIIWVEPDSRPDNSSRRILIIEQGRFDVLTYELLINLTESIRNATVQYYGRLKSELLQTQNIGDVKDVLDFEIELAKVHLPYAQLKNRERHMEVMTISNLTTLLPNVDQFNLTDFLNSITPSVTFTNDTEVAVTGKESLVNIFCLVNEKRPNGLDERNVVRDYLLIRFAHAMRGFMSKRIRALYDDLNKVLTGANKEEVRFKSCVEITNEHLPDPTGLMYVQKYFPETSRQMVLNMTKYCKQAIKEMISNTTWMDSETVDEAIEKVDAIIPLIGYPDYTNAMEKYEGVNYSDKEYLQNGVKAKKWSMTENFKKLLKAPKRDEFDGSAAVVNGHYSPPHNSIQLNAAILLPPFYSDNYTMFKKFGGIGMVIGHELGHAFDNRGRQYGKNGNLMNWWSNDTLQNYKKKAQCFVDMINGEAIPLPPETKEDGTNVIGVGDTVTETKEDGTNVIGVGDTVTETNANGTNATGVGDTVTMNGEKIQPEFISDVIGVKAAYLAYKLWERDNGPEEITANSFSHDELFFIKISQVWCAKYRRETLINNAKSSTHPMAMIRGKLPSANFAKFAEVFNCSATAKMNRAVRDDHCPLF